jgi:hypothetical protein
VFIESDAINANILRGGVLYVGYFNGGVQGLRFTARNVAIEESVRKGTREIRVDQAKRVTSYLLIFYGLLFSTLVAAVTMCRHFQTIRGINKKTAFQVREYNSGRYGVLALTLFGPYPAITYEDARQLLGVDDDVFASLLDELELSPVDRVTDLNTRTLPRALYQANHPDDVLNPETGEAFDSDALHAKAPSVDQYAAWLAEQNIAPMSIVDLLNARGVKVGDNQFGGDTKKANKMKKPAAGGRNSAASMNAVMLSVLGTIQAASIYSSTWTLPDVYLGNMVPALRVISLDFFDSIFDNPLAAPIVQLTFSILVIGGVMFAFVKDDTNFFRNAIRYQHRRDRADGIEGALSEGALNYLLRKVDRKFLLEKLFPSFHSIRLMEPGERAQLQLFEDDKEVDELDLRSVAGRLLFTKLYEAEKTEEKKEEEEKKTNDDTDVQKDSAPAEVAAAGELAVRTPPDVMKGADGDALTAQPTKEIRDKGHVALRCTSNNNAEASGVFAPPGLRTVDTVIATPDPVPGGEGGRPRLLSSSGDALSVRQGSSEVSRRRRRSSVAVGILGSPLTPEELRVRSRDGSVCDGAASLVLPNSSKPANQQDTTMEYDPCQLRKITCYCVEHPECMLSQVVQSNVYPYRNRRTCCVVENGKRCGKFEGVIYACPHESSTGHPIFDIIDGEEDCAYAVCADHFRADGLETLRLGLRAFASNFLSRGGAWVFFYFVVTVALALYTPVMRTCLMILSCHPLYQCEFPDCWSAIDQKFAAAVYLSALMALLFGVGFPLAFFKVLSDRYKVLNGIFTHVVYNGRYLEPTEDDELPNRHRGARIVTSIGALIASFFSALFATLRVDATVEVVQRWFAARALWLAGEDHIFARLSSRSPRESADYDDEYTEDDDDTGASKTPVPQDEFGFQVSPASPNGGLRSAIDPSDEWEGRGEGRNPLAGPVADGGNDELPPKKKPAPQEVGTFELTVDEYEHPAPEMPAEERAFTRRPQTVDTAHSSGSPIVASSGGLGSFASAHDQEHALLASTVTARPVSSGADGPVKLDSVSNTPENRPINTPQAARVGMAEFTFGTSEMTGLGPTDTAAPPPADAEMSPDDPALLDLSRHTQAAELLLDDNQQPPTSRAVTGAAATQSNIHALITRQRRLLEPKGDKVAVAEWQRFLLSDPSALAPLYEQVNFESMRFIPVLHCAKFALLIPPLLLEPNSLLQLGVIALGEVSYAVALAVMAPYLTIWMSLITLAGNIHQFMLIALQAFSAAHANDEDLSDSIGRGMLSITLIYLIGIALLVAAMIAAPIIAKVLGERELAKLCAMLGVARPKTASLYVSPYAGAVSITAGEVTSADVGGDEDALAAAKALKKQRRNRRKGKDDRKSKRKVASHEREQDASDDRHVGFASSHDAEEDFGAGEDDDGDGYTAFNEDDDHTHGDQQQGDGAPEGEVPVGVLAENEEARNMADIQASIVQWTARQADAAAAHARRNAKPKPKPKPKAKRGGRSVQGGLRRSRSNSAAGGPKAAPTDQHAAH